MVKKTVTITLDPEVVKKAKEAAKETGMSFSGFINYTLRKRLGMIARQY